MKEQKGPFLVTKSSSENAFNLKGTKPKNYPHKLGQREAIIIPVFPKLFVTSHQLPCINFKRIHQWLQRDRVAFFKLIQFENKIL
jgi:hypothetical protein